MERAVEALTLKEQELTRLDAAHQEVEISSRPAAMSHMAHSLFTQLQGMLVDSTRRFSRRQMNRGEMKGDVWERLNRRIQAETVL